MPMLRYGYAYAYAGYAYAYHRAYAYGYDVVAFDTVFAILPVVYNLHHYVHWTVANIHMYDGNVH